MIRFAYYFQIGLYIDLTQPNTFDLPKAYSVLTSSEVYELIQQNNILHQSEIYCIRFYHPLLPGWLLIKDNDSISSAEIGEELKLILTTTNPDISFETKIQDLSERISDQFLKLNEIERSCCISSLNNTQSRQPSLNLNNISSDNFISDGCISSSCDLLNGHHYISGVFQSGLDIAFIYSNPLFNEQGIAMNEGYEYHQEEISDLVNYLEQTEKRLTARIEVATVENLTNIIKKQPKILHIACQGGYDHDTEKFYLNFEDRRGRLKKIFSEDLISIFKSFKEEKQIGAAVITCCHSKEASELLCSSNIPLVVSLYSNPMTSNRAAMKFLKIFYESLLDGECIQNSFDTAMTVVSKDDKYRTSLKDSCCCFHTHSSNCKWKQIAVANHEIAHLLHLRYCTCSSSPTTHFHTSICDLKEEDTITVVKSKKFCCCSPEIPHDGEFKFLMKTFDQESNEKKFLFRKPSLMVGSLVILTPNFLDLKFSHDPKKYPYGMNEEMLILMDAYEGKKSPKMENTRLITITGESKKRFGKAVGVYLYTHGYFTNVYYVEFESCCVNEYTFIKTFCYDLEYISFQINTLTDLASNIDSNSLIILHFINTSSETISTCRNIVNTILENSKLLKLLVLSRIPLKIESEKVIALPGLDQVSSMKLLYSLTCESLPVKNFNFPFFRVLISLAKGNPEKILQIANLLIGGSKVEDIITQMESDSLNWNEIIKKLLQDNPNDKDILYTFFYFPKGFLCQDLSKVFDSRSVINRIYGYQYLVKVSIKDLGSDALELPWNFVKSLQFLSKNILDQESNEKICLKLLGFYATLFRKLVLGTRKSEEEFSDFTAGQNYGMWLSFSKQCQPPINDIVTGNPQKYFQHNYENLKQLIDPNFLLTVFPQTSFEIYPNELQEIIEQLSICIPTILKQISIEVHATVKQLSECFSAVKDFKTILDSFHLDLAKARLILFECYLTHMMQLSWSEHNSLDHVINIFNSHSFNEGTAEVYFFQGVNRMKFQQQGGVDLIEYSLAMYDSSSLGYARACCYLAWFNIVDNMKGRDIDFANLINAHKIFTIHDRKVFAYKTSILLSKWKKLRDEFCDALYWVEEAAKINLNCNQNAKSVKFKKESSSSPIFQINEVKELKTAIFNQIRITHHNVFVFLQANQLVTKSSNAFYQQISSEGYFAVSPYVTYPEILLEEIQTLSSTNKQILFSFDILTENTFLTALRNQGRVLCISSKVYNETNSLFVEGSFGDAVEVEGERIEEILQQFNSNSHVIFDLVILAYPMSMELGQIFLKAGVPHVVCFAFDRDTLKYIHQLINFPLSTFLTMFTITIAKEIIAEKTVQLAFDTSRTEFLEHFKFVKDKIYFNEYYINANTIHPILLPHDSSHNVILFKKTSQEYTVSNNLEFSFTKTLNISKRTYALIGRKKLHFRCLQAFQANKNEIKCLNLYGNRGIGKTTSAKEIAYHLSMKQEFKGGVFFFDVKDVTTVDQLIEIFSQNEVLQAIQECHDHDTSHKVLIILDNCDKIAQRMEMNFYLLINQNTEAYFLFTSRKEILKSFNKIQHIEITPLNFIKSAYMFLYYCNRKLQFHELKCGDSFFFDNRSTTTFFDLLMHSYPLGQCQGYPKYIEKLSELTNQRWYSSINENEFLPRKWTCKILDQDQQLKGKLTESIYSEKRISIGDGMHFYKTNSGPRRLCKKPNYTYQPKEKVTNTNMFVNKKATLINSLPSTNSNNCIYPRKNTRTKTHKFSSFQDKAMAELYEIKAKSPEKNTQNICNRTKTMSAIFEDKEEENEEKKMKNKINYS